MKLILIVDDEIDIIDTFSMLFEVHGYDVIAASNGRDALALLDDCTPDLIISDCMMPIMDGVTFRRHVQQSPRLAALPFILMSAAPDRHDLSSITVNHFLKKPFQFDELIAIVKKMVPV